MPLKKSFAKASSNIFTNPINNFNSLSTLNTLAPIFLLLECIIISTESYFWCSVVVAPTITVVVAEVTMVIMAVATIVIVVIMHGDNNHNDDSNDNGDGDAGDYKSGIGVGVLVTGTRQWWQ